MPCSEFFHSVPGAVHVCAYFFYHRSNFLPATGVLKHLSQPLPSANVRVDGGVRQGDAVSVFYDPMISKVSLYLYYYDSMIST